MYRCVGVRAFLLVSVYALVGARSACVCVYCVCASLVCAYACVPACDGCVRACHSVAGVVVPPSPSPTHLRWRHYLACQRLLSNNTEIYTTLPTGSSISESHSTQLRVYSSFTSKPGHTQPALSKGGLRSGPRSRRTN